MQQSLILDFLKEIAVGFKAAKSYPPGHPVMEKVVSSTLNALNKVYNEYPGFSMYFLEQTLIFQDVRIDLSKNVAVISLLEALKKNEINSLTFALAVGASDIKNLYEVMSSGKLKVKEYGDAATMLSTKGTERIRINAVKFGIQDGATVQIAQEANAVTRQYMEKDIIESIKGLKEIVEKGISTLTFQEKLDEMANSTEGMPDQNLQIYSEAVSKIIMSLPKEQRLEILKKAELKPFVLKILSNVDEETVKNLIVGKVETQNQTDVNKILGMIGEDKFTTMLPELKPLIPNLYEYLAQVGLLLSEKITSTISKEDLRASIKPYYGMLESQNARLRGEGLKSLVTLAVRFIQQGHNEIAEEIVQRLSLALEHEAAEEIVLQAMEPMTALYQACHTQNQEQLCKLIVDPFSKILGRPGVSAVFKKAGIRFLSDTANPVVLPTLLTFLWETGIYPDVRAAIIKFGKDAVIEALSTLKEAEDHSLRMKLVDIIKNIGSEAVSILLTNLDTSEWFLRRNIIAILGDIGEKDVAPRLIGLCADSDDRVRIELTKAFAKLDYSEGLVTLLSDPSIEVKAEVLRNLKKGISNEKIQELLPLFKEKGDSVHLELLKIINEKKIIEAASPIADLLRTLQVRDDSTAQNLKELGITTLVKLGDPNLETILEEYSLSKDKALANLATAALKHIG